MNKNKNISRSWKDVKLYQLQELNSLQEFDDKIDMMIEYLSILLNIDPSEVENMPINELMVEFSKWEFLKELPEEKKIDIIKINGKRFGLINLSEMSFAQMVDIEEYINDGGTMQNLHKILSVIYLPIDKYNVFTKRYTLKPYESSEELQKEFLTLDMSILYPTALFFYHIVQTYLKNSALSLVQMKKEKMMEMISKEEELSQTQRLMLLKELEKYGTGTN
jgi:hypothetical protein